MEPKVLNHSRASHLETLGNETFDVLVIGGGISGITAAHTLTRRGFRTALIDSHDFASGTSQESSQLIWGGIKYLEHGHAKLVHKLCGARNRLAAQYPARVQSLRFLYPHFDHDPHGLPMLMAGAWIYWMLGRGFDRRPLRLRTPAIHGRVPDMRAGNYEGGFEYSDARMVVSDARLALDLLFDSIDAGLTAVNYLNFESCNWNSRSNSYHVQVAEPNGGSRFSITARWIVNTAGIWVDEVNKRLGVAPPHQLCFSKGIHLVIPKIETSGRALTCLAKDRRVFFVIPWGEVTLIGTTDTPYEDPPRRVRADRIDIEYLMSECEAKFKIRLTQNDVLNTKAGLRPLLRPKNLRGKDFLALSRSHKVWSDSKARVTALWGGKYTDSFLMADEIADQIAITPSANQRSIETCTGPAMPDETWMNANGDPDAGLAEACRREWVVQLEDLLRRRTNIALKVPRAGWGLGNQFEPALKKFASAIAEANGSDWEPILETYRQTHQSTVASS